MGVRTLRGRLVTAFLLATVLPLAATVWITTTLLERSLGYATTGGLDRLSHTLEGTVRELYQRERDALRQDVLAGAVPATTFQASDMARWPDAVRAFWESGDAERFALSGSGGDRVDYLRRDDGMVRRYTRDLRGIRMDDLSAQFREARGLVASLEQRDLRRGFTLTLLILLATAWLVSLVPLLFIAHRISRPVRQLTAGLTSFAADETPRLLDAPGDDEVGRAVKAFNSMAQQLHESRARLVHLTQMASWQSLARKTAHELKNSLTPIRLTVEEMVARQPPGVDRTFMGSAAQIVVSEIDTLERRVRAFSEFATEPEVRVEEMDVRALVAERVALLAPAHPQITFDLQLDAQTPHARADVDLLKGTLTNLLQNAAEAAGPIGRVLVIARRDGTQAIVEIHDSGPGLSPEVAATLFEPTITFKRHGMGLGLSIARRNALLCGGDVCLTASALAGAAFRVTLPAVV
jgi:two-component system, NtrC family, nitrogen regulation sensor histidine kinase NtrY